MSNPHSIALLFLAAGASRRMGRPKALLPWHGKTVVAHHFQTLKKSSGRFFPWIVSRPDDTDLQTELDFIGWPREQRTINPDAPDCEMFDSIRCGLRVMLAHPAQFPTLGIALIDQVLTQPETFQVLEKSARDFPQSILQPECYGRRGHPVLLPRKRAEELITFDGLSLRDFLDSHNDFRMAVPVNDEGVIRDMDTPQDYKEQHT